MLGLAFLVLWELLHDRPIVDVPLFRHANFAASMAVMFVTGFILISTTQLIPRFLQSMLGYTATEAGLALTAGGVATLFVMPLAGALTRKVQPKYLIMFGLTVETLAAIHLSGFNTEISFAHAAWARVFQAVGLPFLFVPISTAAYTGLPPDKSNNASALINTMRNLGGSVGISVATTVLARREQFHHSRLAETINPFSVLYQSHLHEPVVRWARLVQEQAAMLSYIDVFSLVACLAAVAIPVTFFLRRTPTGAAAVH